MEVMQLVVNWSEELIHFFSMQVLFSVILYIIIYVLSRILKTQSRFFMMSLWSLIFIRLVLPPSWSHGFSGRKILEYFFRVPVSIEKVPFLHSSSEVLHPIFQQDVSGSSELQFISPATILTGLWLTGVLILSALYLYRLWKYRCIMSQSEPCKDPALLGMVELWRSEFGVCKPVKLVTGYFHKPPFTIGFFKPVIYIPKLFCEKPNPAILESIISHEMVHVKNRDDLWIRFQNIIQIFYFFNPVVWLAGAQLGQVREQFCDAMVLSKKRLNREAYGNGLLNIVQFNLKANILCQVPAFSGEKKRMTERIWHIAQARSLSKKQMLLSMSLFLILGLILLPMGASSISEQQSRSHLISPFPGGVILLEFGKDWNCVEQKYQMHTGIDIGDSGQPKTIVAAADGEIISTGNDEIFKEYREITIQHEDGLITRYLHVNKLFIKPGDRIKQGELIGQVYSCVHFEVYKNGELRDPEDFLVLEKQLVRTVLKE